MVSGFSWLVARSATCTCAALHAPNDLAALTANTPNPPPASPPHGPQQPDPQTRPLHALPDTRPPQIRPPFDPGL